MKKGLTTEHNRELLCHTFPRLLNTGRVTDKDTRHFHSDGRNIANRCLEVVGNPLDKVSGILANHFEHFVIDLLARHVSAEHHGACEVASMTGIRGAHHILGIKCLLCKLGNGEYAEVMRGCRCKGGESHEEEVETREWHHIDGELAQIAVQLTRESERTGRSGDGGGDKVVQISVARVRKLQGAEANIVESFIIEGEALVGVFYELVNRKSGIVRLNHRIGDLR
mmetsp:Transcript_17609/g.36998  ORF Transcript_17609/g.36998 Transcript_17609/m.36998 type:complete len:225 (+) Transcript_17609:352-1026(+)